MSVLITGATGKTSMRLANILKQANVPYIRAVRRTIAEFSNDKTTHLDWFDETTFHNVFKENPNISAVYLIPPETMEPASPVNKFIDIALKNGVKKFVLLGGTSTQKGSGVYVEPIWAHLEVSRADFAVLRPTWFMENFSELQHQKDIKEHSTFNTAAEDGKVWFVSVEDIAEAAFAFLSGKKDCENRDWLILGPELLSHDEVATTLSEELGRTITHVRKSQEEMVEHYKKVGVKPLYANFLPYLETVARDGKEAEFKNDLEQIIGRKGLSLREWAQKEAKKYF